jgi:RNA methyltransferase, TrmH family
LAGVELISSRRNPLVRQLRQLQEPRGRREQGLLLLEGTHLVQEALRLGLSPVHLLATGAWLQAHAELVQQLPPACRPQPVTAEVLAAVATTRHPDGVVLALAPPEARRSGPPDLWLVLDTVQDPGNLGTLIRTALAAGVGALWLADGADPYQPKVLRASAGAALALPHWRGDRAALLEQLRSLRDQQGVQLVATLPPGQGGAALLATGLDPAHGPAARQRGGRPAPRPAGPGQPPGHHSPPRCGGVAQRGRGGGPPCCWSGSASSRRECSPAEFWPR